MAITFYDSVESPIDNTAYGTDSSGHYFLVATPPAGIQQGDLLLITCAVRSSSSVNMFMTTNNGGQDWNVINAGGSNNITGTFFWCTFNGTWVNDPVLYCRIPRGFLQLTLGCSGYTGGGVNLPKSLVFSVFRPTDTSKTFVLDTTNVGASISATTTPVLASTTTVTSGALAYWTVFLSSAVTCSIPAPFSGTAKTQYRNTSGSGITLVEVYRVMSPAGATGTCTLTLGASSSGATFRMAFKEV